MTGTVQVQVGASAPSLLLLRHAPGEAPVASSNTPVTRYTVTASNPDRWEGLRLSVTIGTVHASAPGGNINGGHHLPSTRAHVRGEARGPGTGKGAGTDKGASPGATPAVVVTRVEGVGCAVVPTEGGVGGTSGTGGAGGAAARPPNHAVVFALPGGAETGASVTCTVFLTAAKRAEAPAAHP